MAAIPFELIEDILRRLPVRTLKRCRAVAKPWCYLIDSENFVKLHFRQSLISNSNRNLVAGGLGVFSIDVDSPGKAHPIKQPFYYKSSDAISNSCNGIVLVMSEPPVLWNPYSRDYKVLPQCSVDNPDQVAWFPKTTYGFGYDLRNDDYKVVRVVEFRSELTYALMYSEARIYSPRSNCWRKIESFPYQLPFLRGHWRVHVNSAMHTLVESESDHMLTVKIMAFSVETEKHYEVMMPPGIKMRGVNPSLDVIDGCLSLVCAHRSRVVIWVMREYGVEKSWTKLFTISPPEIEPDDFVKPLVYSREGDRILLNCSDKRLVWYDFRDRSVENVTVEGLPFVFYAEPCVQTLISPNGPNTIKKLGTGRTKKKKIKNARDDFLSEGFKLVL